MDSATVDRDAIAKEIASKFDAEFGNMGVSSRGWSAASRYPEVVELMRACVRNLWHAVAPQYADTKRYGLTMDVLVGGAVSFSTVILDRPPRQIARKIVIPVHETRPATCMIDPLRAIAEETARNEEAVARMRPPPTREDLERDEAHRVSCIRQLPDRTDAIDATLGEIKVALGEIRGNIGDIRDVVADLGLQISKLEARFEKLEKGG